MTNQQPDLVTEARALLNAPNNYMLRLQVRELLCRLCNEVERLRKVVDIPPHERSVCDCHTWPTVSELHDYVAALEAKLEQLPKPRVKEAMLDEVLDCERCNLCEDHHA